MSSTASSGIGGNTTGSKCLGSECNGFRAVHLERVSNILESIANGKWVTCAYTLFLSSQVVCQFYPIFRSLAPNFCTRQRFGCLDRTMVSSAGNGQRCVLLTLGLLDRYINTYLVRRDSTNRTWVEVLGIQSTWYYTTLCHSWITPTRPRITHNHSFMERSLGLKYRDWVMAVVDPYLIIVGKVSARKIP